MLKDARQTVAELLRANQTLQRLFTEFEIDFESVQNLLVKDALIANDTLIQATTVYNLAMNPANNASIEAINLKVSQKLGLYPTYIIAPHSTNYKAYTSSSGTAYTYFLKWLYYTYKFFNEEQFFFNNLLNHYVPGYDREIVSSTTNLKIYFDGLGILLDALDKKIEDLYTLGNVDMVDDSFLKHIAQLLGYQLEDFSIQNISFRELIKNLIDIYKTKGTNYSFELFFKLLGFDAEIREYYWDRESQNAEAFGSITDTNYLWYLTVEDPRLRTTEQPIDSSDWVDPKDLRVFNNLLNAGYDLDEVLSFKDSAIPVADRFTYFKTNYIKFNLTQYYTKQDLTAKDTDTILKYIKFLTPIYVSALIEVETLPYEDEFIMENTDSAFVGSGDPGSPRWVDILMPFLYVTLRDYIPLQLSPTSENEIAIVNSGSIDDDSSGYGDDALPLIFGSPRYGIAATGTIAIGSTVDLSVEKYINIKLDKGRGTKISIPGATAPTIGALRTYLDTTFLTNGLGAQTSLVGLSPNRDVRIYSNTYSSYSKIFMLPGITNDLFTGLSTTIAAPTDGYTANRGFQDLGLTLISDADSTGLLPGTTYEFYINVDTDNYSEIDASGPTASATTKADIVNAINNHFDLSVESYSVPTSTVEYMASDSTTNGTIAVAYRNITTSSGKIVLVNSDGTLYKTNIDFSLYDCKSIAISSCTSLTTRRFLVSWYDTDNLKSKWIVYDDEGVKVTLEATLDSNVAVDIVSTTLSNDNIAVAFTYGSSGKVAVFDISGASPSLLFTKTWSNDAISSGTTAISALEDGFVVAGNKASGGVIVYFKNDGTYLLGTPDLVSSTIAFTATGKQASFISLQQTEVGNIFITYRANDTGPTNNKIYIAIFDNTGTEVLAANAITAYNVDFVKSVRMQNDSILIPYCKNSDGIGYYLIYSPSGDQYKKEKIFYDTTSFSELTVSLIGGEDIAFNLITPTDGYFSYWSYVGEPASLSGSYLVISSSSSSSTWDDDVNSYSDATDDGHFFRMGTNAYEHDNYSSSLRTLGVDFVAERNRYNTFWTASPTDDLIDLVEDTLQFAFTLLVTSVDHPANRVEAAGFYVRRNGYITRNQSQESWIGSNLGTASPRTLGYYTRKQDYSETLRVDPYRINSEIDWAQWKKLGASYDEWSSWALAVEYFEIPSVINTSGYIGGEIFGAPIIPVVLSGVAYTAPVAADVEFTMSGGIVLSGAYTRHYVYTITVAAITLSGAATTSAFVYYRYVAVTSATTLKLSGVSTTTYARTFEKIASGGIVISGAHYRPEVNMVFIPIMAVTPLALGGASLSMEYLLSSAGGMILSGAATTNQWESSFIYNVVVTSMILSGTEHNYAVEFSYDPQGQLEAGWIELSGVAETYRDRFYTWGEGAAPNWNGDINLALVGALGTYTLGPFGLGAIFVGSGGVTVAGAYTYVDFGLGPEWISGGGITIGGVISDTEVGMVYVPSGSAFAIGGSASYREPIEYTGSGEIILSGIAETNRDPIEYTSDGEITLSGAATTMVKIIEYTGDGDVILGGSANWQLGGDFGPSGVVVLSGLAQADSIDRSYIPSGTVSLSGAATSYRIPIEYVGGSMGTLGGTATPQVTIVFVVSGSTTLSGAATSYRDRFYIGSGATTLSGAATSYRDRFYISSGSTTLSGAAIVVPPTYFGTTWKTNNTGYTETTSTQIKLPLASGGTYSFVVYWGDGSSSTVTAYDDADITHTYSIAGTYNVDIVGTCQGFGFASANGDKSKLIDIKNWGNVRLHNNGYQFYRCDKLTTFSANDELDLTGVTNASRMFYGASLFNGDISDWDVSAITNMSNMFYGATVFNGDIGGWTTNNVTNMSSMFYNATAFNQDVGNWNVNKVIDMSAMFGGSSASVFNQDLSNWDTSKVTNMSFMFYNAAAFNKDISIWEVGSVTLMNGMFFNALSFNQNLDIWDVSKVTDAESMFEGATLSTNNYDALLNGWDPQSLNSSVKFHGGNSKYSSVGSTARAHLISSDLWTITDGGTGSAFRYNTITGGPIVSGAALTYRTPILYIGSGGAIHSGGASKTIGFIRIGSGTLTISGTSVRNVIRIVSTSGTATLGGSAIRQVTIVFATSGTSTLNGSATRNISRIVSTSGTATLSGAILITEVDRIVGAGGTSTLSGAAIRVFELSRTVSGSGTLSGAMGAAIVDRIVGAGGTSTLSGAATRVFELSRTANGTATLSGAILITEVDRIVGAGGIGTLSGAMGAAIVDRVVGAGGEATLSGDATTLEEDA